ncbi:hypothetical protein F7725_009920 [Dissostichus mawsoni]|uniref:TNF family profile domain-containing protein n=1 Tax=Dissostichus mawsoni TaxID=36200 RepID=A0A7J5XM30_DISMA|nr:hypothetical protein F7725_009920 [Dissostichus mawsoni]
MLKAQSSLKMFSRRVKREQGSCRGIVQLHQDDELELVIPNRQHTLISMDAESTFFGVIQLN